MASPGVFFEKGLQILEKMHGKALDSRQKLQLLIKSLEYFLAGLRREKGDTPIARLVKERVNAIFVEAEKLKSETEPSATSAEKGTSESKELGGFVTGARFDADWDDLKGCDTAKDALEESVMLPLIHPTLFEGKRKASKAVLLFGPSGTGKTMIAQALAKRAGISFFSVSSSDLISKWMGESEKAIRKLFETARANRPALIFLDEVDNLGRARGAEENPAVRRIKTELLKQLDGVGTDNEGILFLAATNTPWELDSALRRRFDRRIHVPLPDASARGQIFSTQMDGEELQFPKEELAAFGKEAERFSGADLSIVAREALMAPVRQAVTSNYFRKEGGKYYPCDRTAPGAEQMTIWDLPDPEKLAVKPISLEQLRAAFAEAKPTVSRDDVKRQEEYDAIFGEGKATAEPPPPEVSRRREGQVLVTSPPPPAEVQHLGAAGPIRGWRILQ